MHPNANAVDKDRARTHYTGLAADARATSTNETIRERLEREARVIHEALADPILAEPDSEDLVLTRLPSGNFAWLRPEPRYVLTDQGRAAIGRGAA